MSNMANFDWLYYGRKNADVLAAFGWNETALKNHWTSNGQSEGRNHRFFNGQVSLADFTGHNHSAADVVTGTFTAAQIPMLNASKVTSGTFTTAQVPTLNPGSISANQIALARFPNFDASRIPDNVHPDRIKASIGANGWEQVGAYILAGWNGAQWYGQSLISGANIRRSSMLANWMSMHNQGQNGTWRVVGYWRDGLDRRQITTMMRVA